MALAWPGRLWPRSQSWHITVIVIVIVVFKKLEGLKSIASTIRGQSWSDTLHAMKVSSVLDVVGIWEYSKHIYMLRKHPGLAMLNNEEKEQGDLDKDEDDEQAEA